MRAFLCSHKSVPACMPQHSETEENANLTRLLFSPRYSTRLMKWRFGGGAPHLCLGKASVNFCSNCTCSDFFVLCSITPCHRNTVCLNHKHTMDEENSFVFTHVMSSEVKNTSLDEEKMLICFKTWRAVVQIGLTICLLFTLN